MSATELQRVAVRMLFDGAFARAVYADAERALAGVALSRDERAWLREPDPRAWGCDRFRRSRALKAVLEEYPCALLAGVPDAAALGRLDGFFSASAFHQCIQARGSLALSFADWCLQSPPPGCFQTRLARGLLTLERAIARLRRAEAPGPGTGLRLRLAAHVAVLDLPEGSLSAYRELGQRLANEDPVALLLAGKQARRLQPPGTQAGGREQVLLEARGGKVSVEHSSPAVFGLLRAAEGGRERESLAAVARGFGAEPGEDLEVLADFVAQGLLEPAD